MKWILSSLAAGLLSWGFAATPAMASSTVSLTPFTATYQAYRKGSLLGTSTWKLKQNRDGTWQFTTSLEAKHGIASFLSARIEEQSHFAYKHENIQLLSYDYQLKSAIKTQREHIQVNQETGKVATRTKKKQYHYAAKPGMVSKQLIILALGIQASMQHVPEQLVIADKKRLKTYSFALDSTQTITVPAGKFVAMKIKRTQDDKDFRLWFAPGMLGIVPAQIAQATAGGMTLKLQSLQRTKPDS